jgi:protein-S-isoprenylcysteine O-methyltransferase Ste14
VSAVLRRAMALLIGLVIFLGLPLLSWGVRDVRGFVDDSARLLYILLVVLLQIVVLITMPESGRNRGTRQKDIPRRRLDLVLIQVISLVVLIIPPYSDRRDIAVLSGVEIVRYLGLVMFALGMLTMQWAEASLGKQFSVEVTLQEGHELITGGLYHYLRHPRYLGIIVFTVGISLVFRSWLGLILGAVLALILIWRIGVEEDLLHHEFGAAWEDYSRTSWRLIPFVY